MKRKWGILIGVGFLFLTVVGCASMDNSTRQAVCAGAGGGAGALVGNQFGRGKGKTAATVAGAAAGAALGSELCH